ncbi:MAG: GlsB/YeaQ/YmgE family stress response membrane protein [Actinobacteria bacterium]|nr:MAG: GlsB/YeaQ/YmgE family stress response membrane protein [Actinomycetota bacterium]
MLNIIWAIIAGLVIGLLAKLVVPGRQAIPLWLTIVLGIVGALVGNWLATVFGVRHTSGIDWIRHFLQIGVAAVLIIIVAPLWMRRGARRSP